MRLSSNLLKRQLLDNRLAQVRDAAEAAEVPSSGWISTIRDAVGLNHEQLGRRLGITGRAAAQMEDREAAGAITLRNLERAARAMGCRVVYAVVPDDSLTRFVEQQARRVAEASITRVDQTMALEDQAPDSDMRELRIADIADDLIRRNRRELWAGND